MSAQFAAVSATEFDPTSGRFIAQDKRPETWADVDPVNLSPLMRALLVIDGTVTKILEAYFLEPVDVQRIEQSVEQLPTSDAWLQADAGARFVNRSVMLVGRESGRVYTYAQSRIVLERLTERMQERLGDENFGLGRILLDSAAEMRRECLWYGAEALGDVPVALMDYAGQRLVSRTYRVIKEGLPLMKITERFPPEIAFPNTAR